MITVGTMMYTSARTQDGINQRFQRDNHCGRQSPQRCQRRKIMVAIDKLALHKFGYETTDHWGSKIHPIDRIAKQKPFCAHTIFLSQ